MGHKQSENREFGGQRPDESVRPTIAFPFGLVRAVPETMIFFQLNRRLQKKRSPFPVYDLPAIDSRTRALGSAVTKKPSSACTSFNYLSARRNAGSFIALTTAVC